MATVTRRRWSIAPIGAIRTSTIARITALWAAVVLAVLTWQAMTYRGLVARIAEWQFDHIGSYFPTATVFWLVILFSLPLLALLVVRMRRRARLMAEIGRNEVAVLEGARALQRLLTWLAVASLVVAGIMLIAASTIRDGTPRVVAAGGNGAVRGPVRITGALRLNRLGAYRPAMGMAMAPVFFAPLTADDAADPTLRYFVEVPQSQPSAVRSVSVRGIAVANALPGPVRRLYANAGYRIADPVVVVYPDVSAARRPYWRTIPMPLALAALFAVLALIQRRAVRRIMRTATTETVNE